MKYVNKCELKQLAMNRSKNCEATRKISILKILEELGIFPIKKNKREAWFISPLKLENNASFKISLELNRWYDHSIGRGGNVIDLIMLLKNYTVKEALYFLNNNIDSFSFHKQSKSIDRTKNYSIVKIKNLNNKALLNYLQSRKIKVEVAKKYCNEIHYVMNEKNYFAIGFKNISNGYEIRNKYFKGCLEKKDFTILKNGGNTVLIFEGFFDFLSYLSLGFINEKRIDFVILNSISMIEKTIKVLQEYNSIFSFLDNDSSGKSGFKILKTNCKNVIDMSFMYNGFKDLNEWLIKKR